MKKIIYKYLSGFAFGAMMLVLCLLLTYAIGGQSYYEQQLSQFISPSALLVQTIWAGILYVCISITIINTHEFLKSKDNEVTLQYLIMYMVHILVVIFVSLLAQEYGSFGVGVYSLLFGLGMIMLMLGTIADMIQNAIRGVKLHKKLIVLKEEELPKKTTTEKAAAKKSATTRKTSTKSKAASK